MISIKQQLQENNQALQQAFVNGTDIGELLHKRSQTIDEILIDLWPDNNTPSTALIAVGGYGREEMHPASDVDLLILLKHEPNETEQEQLSNFVTTLWDLGLEIGHSVRTLDECINEARNDLTVITNLIESRFLCGDNTLFAQLHDQLSPQKGIWSSRDFFNAKMEEQAKRYKRYGDTAYRVEPNLKDGPGGLRDLQTIGWIALREFGIHSIKELSHYNLLNKEEYQALIEARDFLWKVRFSLHQIAGRKEDRLLFDYQHQLAEIFCETSEDEESHKQCIETFMQQYYRTITELERLNEMLLGLIRQRILHTENTPPKTINHYYHNNDGYLGLSQKQLFKTHPHTMLEVFHIMQIIPELKGLTPETLRELKQNLHRIDETFRNNAHHKQIFMNIMSESQGITFALRRMNRYGVLAAYIPAFENIVGRMQYDLFHAYTVDDHTLNVIRNIRRLSTPSGAEELPFCSKIFKTLQIPTILYLAGLFHDIAKGRGGSHSEKGAVDALEFCLSHDMNQHDAETVSWLVRNHLEMSSIAQRKDINDPEIIQGFADLVAVQSRLDYLYLLTICDIKGTNPTLLNSWKHSLLKGLYRATKMQLKSQYSANKNSIILIQQKKKAVETKLLNSHTATQQQIDTFWQRVDARYILQHTVESLLWQITEIIHHDDTQPLIRIRSDENNKSTLLFIYTKDQKNLFIKITSALEQQHLNVVAARISSSHDGYVLDTLNILDANNEMLSLQSDQEQLIENLQKKLTSQDFSINFQHHRTPRQLKHFNTPTRVDFEQDNKYHQTIITIYTADRPGLLTQISEVFIEQGLTIHDARISTLGETAEDIFHVTLLEKDQKTNKEKMITTEDEQQRVRNAIVGKLQGN
jgi:[protein-PII] uridylyltransferase